LSLFSASIASYIFPVDFAASKTELNNAERLAVQNAGDRARTRLGDLAGLAAYLKWPVFVGFSRTVNKPVG